MSLAELLAERNVRRALVVDDAIDAVPTAADLSNLADEWGAMIEDLDAEQRELIDNAYPQAVGRPFDEKISDDGYVAAVWELREQLGEAVEPVFDAYVANQKADMRHVREVEARLVRLGLEVTLRGREFQDAADAADLVVIDLYLGGAQNKQAFDLSKRLLGTAVKRRRAAPPLVLLMSRSGQLQANRDEFRDEAGLIESGFRVISKQEIAGTEKFERQLERLARAVDDTRKLARFFSALDDGMASAASRTLGAMRRMRLSDIGQMQQLLLEFEGEPPGSYLVDVFDRVLQHEIERDEGIIDAALDLNGISSSEYPPPYVAGSPGLQELVQRMLAQHPERVRLRSSPDWPVSFGDVLRVRPVEGDAAPFPVEVGAEHVLLVLTPACDLQRGAAERVLLLVGSVKPLDREAWRYGGDARTPSIMVDGQLSWIAWKLKHIDTVAWPALREAMANGRVEVVARLREAPALELQQRLLSGLGRVGLVAPMPATFPVEVEAYVPDGGGVPRPVNVPEFADGAVCYVGRDAEAKVCLRLVLTEPGCDGLEQALAGMNIEDVANASRPSFQHVRTSGQLRRELAAGLVITKSASTRKWQNLPAKEAPANVQNAGQIGWGVEVSTEPLDQNQLRAAGLMLLVRDVAGAGPGVEDVLRAGGQAAATETPLTSEPPASPA